jgi:hypothetical protein
MIYGRLLVAHLGRVMSHRREGGHRIESGSAGANGSWNGSWAETHRGRKVLISLSRRTRGHPGRRERESYFSHMLEMADLWRNRRQGPIP